MEKIKLDLMHFDEERDEVIYSQELLVNLMNQQEEASEKWHAFERAKRLLGRRINELTEILENLEIEKEKMSEKEEEKNSEL